MGERLPGGTPRYLAPEAVQSPGPAADMFALGVLLAELVDPQVAEATNTREAIAKATFSGVGEIAHWIEALVARAPGARPSAHWVADRAARVLGLARDRDEERAARRALVRRTYLAVRRAELSGRGRAGDGLSGAPRTWIEEVLEWQPPQAVPPGLQGQ